MNQLAPEMPYSIIEEFWDHPSYLQALTDSIRPTLEKLDPDLLVLTYHGIPKGQVLKTRNQKNYHAQCLLTSKKVRLNLGLPVEKVKSTFQSRLGPVKWIRPFTDFVLRDLPKKGIKRIVLASPAFSADCLETLEEIEIRYQELFKENGGIDFHYVPCLNSSDSFVDALHDILKPHL
jgi:ferrochelatase